MFPWIWLYAPQISWPLSGAVTEDFSTQAKIACIKSQHRQARGNAATALLDQIAADSPEELSRLLRRYDRSK